ncbi:MAG TPA: diguanylate cyclase [Actinomycetota bacterium]|nr:diguanylate cyclase [Actinomycetota bacterium]
MGVTNSTRDSYRRLADVFHHVMAEEDLSSLLDRIADALNELIPHDTLNVYEADEATRTLTAVLARDEYANEVLNSSFSFGQGITGRAVQERIPVLANHAHLDPRGEVVPGTTRKPESFMSIPLIARGACVGALNVYRDGADAYFTEEELDLASRFGDAAALALDNVRKRGFLERLAHTDSLTGLYNHRFFHERLNAELARAVRSSDLVALMMLDIDDFKRLNDIYGHGVGDEVLASLSEILRDMVRASDIVCRLGGEEFAIILPSNGVLEAQGLSSRLRERLRHTTFAPAGAITVSIGVAQGPQHATKPRELMACSEAAMMTAKARGKDRVVAFDETSVERPAEAWPGIRGIRSMAHMKMLQSLAGKLNRLNDVRGITDTIADELGGLIDYHSCRVYVADVDLLVPMTLRGELEVEPQAFTCRFGEGIAGTAAKDKSSLLIPNARDCDYAIDLPGTEDIDESMIATPLLYGDKVIGVVVVVQLGRDQFDHDDQRLLEILAGNAAVALENARLYEARSREATNAKSLLLFAETMAKATSLDAVNEHTVALIRSLLGATQATVRWGIEPGTQSNVDGGRPFPDSYLTAHPLRPEAHTTSDRSSGEQLEVVPLVGVHGCIEVSLPVDEHAVLRDERAGLLAGISFQVSLAIQRIAASKAQRESTEIATSLLNFGRALDTAEGLEVVQSRIVETIGRFLGGQAVVLWGQDPRSGSFKVHAARSRDGDLEELPSELELPEKEGLRFSASRKPWALDDESEMGPLRAAMRLGQDASVCVASLELSLGRPGFVTVGGNKPDDLHYCKKLMLLLAGMVDQAKLAIKSAASFESLETAFLSTVEALAGALEAKDEYTSSHARWITDASLAVGERLGLPSDRLKNLELGALFHDIGKIGIPHSILLKPGPLYDREWELIKTHPELGERILAPIARLAPVGPIVRHCHERVDGGGYPDGLAAAAIPTESRIIFVCDAFHAMTTDRPYRKKMPIEGAYTVLKENAGTQFDPTIVSLLIALLHESPDLVSAL